MCSVPAGTSGTTQTDVAIVHHLEEWQRHVHLLLASFLEGALLLRLAWLFASINNRPQSVLLILLEDLFGRPWYHAATKVSTNVAPSSLHVSMASSAATSSLPPLSC